jgi:hypothetical protein
MGHSTDICVEGLRIEQNIAVGVSRSIRGYITCSSSLQLQIQEYQRRAFLSFIKIIEKTINIGR